MVKFLYGSSRDRNLFYASGADVNDPFFVLVVDAKKYVFLNGLEFGAFVEQNKNLNIEAVALESLLSAVSQVEGQGNGVGKLAYVILEKYQALLETIYVPTNFPVSIADFLREKHVAIKILSPLFPERAVKLPEEVDAIRIACSKTDSAFQVIESVLQNSIISGDRLLYKGEVLTSEILKQYAEIELMQQGMVSVEDMIISCGGQAAMPHHRGSGPVRPYQTIVCDIYPQNKASGFFADVSRTFVKGQPSAEIFKMYEAVRSAQKLSIEAVKAGVSFESVQKVSETLFVERGFHADHEKGFTHSIGHGLGCEVHELPFVSAMHETILEPGNVITIEPGLYYPQIGGVRIEDVVLVTETGYELLTQPLRSWIIK